jgi:hypothetical protein
MSEVKVNKISPRTNCGTVTLGDSGDTFTIPAGVTLTNSGTATGFGPTGAVSWDTTAVTSSPLTAASGVGYFINTSGGAITVNLPAGSAGAIISLADYTNTWQTNNVTVNANGSEKIGGIAAPAILDTEGQSVTFLYVDATEGWKNIQDSTSNVTGNPFIVATGGTITTCGDYKIHSFTGPGTFTVTNAGTPAGSTTVDYMVVAGGGGSGNSGGGGGGGGAGGYRESVPSPAAWTASPLANPGGALPVSATSYPITVGAGGTNPGNATSGSPSIFSTITSTGGGRGGREACKAGSPGGSGGGGSYTPSGPVGTGNTPPVSPPQGQPGGNGDGGGSPGYGGNGGGGATTAGSLGSPSAGGPGGAGATSSITGSPLSRSGGGGGGSRGSPGTGGNGGGGNGGYPGSAVGENGSTNRGGGGGGGADTIGGNGGSGIVIIRYKFQ